MANINCSACDEIREVAPGLVVNGFDDTMCASLKNDTGLSPSSGNDDCEDLNNMNDCLVGNMETEVDAYDVCDWKTFMKAFIGNVWTVLKGIICAICGLWTNIHSILSRLSKVECLVSKSYDGASFEIGESTSGNSYVVAGKGVSFLKRVGTSDQYSADVGLTYIAGGLATLIGSLRFYSTSFTDSKACPNFDNGNTMTTSASRQGNAVWATTGNTVTPGNELVFEIRLKNSAYPQIKRFFNGFGQEVDAAGFHVMTWFYTGGQYAPGQHGECDIDTGAPSESGLSSGHLVPDGWTYIQVRMSYIHQLITSGNTERSASLRMFMGIRMNSNNITC